MLSLKKSMHKQDLKLFNHYRFDSSPAEKAVSEYWANYINSTKILNYLANDEYPEKIPTICRTIQWLASSVGRLVLQDICNIIQTTPPYSISKENT